MSCNAPTKFKVCTEQSGRCPLLSKVLANSSKPKPASTPLRGDEIVKKLCASIETRTLEPLRRNPQGESRGTLRGISESPQDEFCTHCFGAFPLEPVQRMWSDRLRMPPSRRPPTFLWRTRPANAMCATHGSRCAVQAVPTQDGMSWGETRVAHFAFARRNLEGLAFLWCALRTCAGCSQRNS